MGLTHWGRVTHICVIKLTIIGSDNGLSPGRRQAIIWTNDGILLIGALEINFSEISVKIQTFSFWKNHLKVSSAKWRPFCLDLNELKLCCWPPERLPPASRLPSQLWTIHWYTVQGPVPRTVFRSNSKFNQNMECCSLKYVQLFTMKFCTRHDSYTVVMCAKFCCDR